MPNQREILKLKSPRTKITESIKKPTAKKANPFFPSRYSQFKIRKSNFTVDARIVTCLNRFIYRYRLAKIFKEILVIDKKYMDNTIVGYSTANKLFLAYTAFEAAKEAAELLNLHTSLYDKLELDQVLAGKLRKNKKLKDLMTAEAKSHEVKDGLEKFYRSTAPSNNALQLAYSIRNCFSHGSFTALGAGLNTKLHIDGITELTNTLINHCDELFDIAVDRCIQLSPNKK